MPHIHQSSADSPAAQVASIAFSDTAKRLPSLAKAMVDSVLSGSVTFDQAHAVLSAAESDLSAMSPLPNAAESVWTDDVLPGRKDQ